MKKEKNLSKKIITKKEPEKKLTVFLKEKAGRNNQGRITVRHKGSGVKRLYRIIDFSQEKKGIPAKIIAFEYDPYRTSFIMLLEYDDKEKIYQIAPQGLNVGDEIICDEKTEVKTGNRMKIKNIPVGTFVYNIELEPDRGGKLVRSAGTGAKILAHGDKYTDIEMPSKEIRKILNECYASIGMISFPEWKYINIKKAGTKRLMGIRPTVRGSAMNPVDHPHGGGEGRAPIGLKYPKTPWGKHALGKKTRNKKKWTNKLIIKRRK